MNVRRGNGLDSRCKECQKAYTREREGVLRAAIKESLGGKCLDCGTTEGWLETHHVLFDGREHRLKGSSTRYYKDILENLGDYALLCRSCHTHRHVKQRRECAVEEEKRASGKA